MSNDEQERPHKKAPSIPQRPSEDTVSRNSEPAERSDADALQVPIGAITAVGGDRPAVLRSLYSLAFESAQALEAVGDERRDLLKELAARKSRWPLTLGPYKKVIDGRRQDLIKLGFLARKEKSCPEVACDKDPLALSIFRPTPKGAEVVSTLTGSGGVEEHHPTTYSAERHVAALLENERSLCELKSIVRGHVEALHREAHKGNPRALEHLYSLAVTSAAELERFGDAHPELLRKFARTQLGWPVVIERNKSINDRAQYLRQLGVGTGMDFPLDPKKLFRHPKNQNPLAKYVEDALIMIDAIRKMTEVGPFFELADNIFGGESAATLGLPIDLVPAELVQMYSFLPPLSSARESLSRWQEAVIAAIWHETSGHPEEHPVFREVGAYRGNHGGRSEERYDPETYEIKGEPLPGSRDANIRDAIRQKVRRLVAQFAPDVREAAR